MRDTDELVRSFADPGALDRFAREESARHGSTVSTHVARIKAKLGARTVTEIVGYAHREGLVR